MTTYVALVTPLRSPRVLAVTRGKLNDLRDITPPKEGNAGARRLV